MKNISATAHAAAHGHAQGPSQGASLVVHDLLSGTLTGNVRLPLRANDHVPKALGRANPQRE